MSSRKHPSLLSDRQIRRKLAQERALFEKQVEENLRKHEKSYEEENTLKKQKVDNSPACAANESGILTENRLNRQCLRNYLCNSDSEERSEKILADFKHQLSEQHFQNLGLTSDMIGIEDDTRFDFFDIIQKLYDENYNEEEDENSDWEEGAIYFDALMSLEKGDSKITFMNNIRDLCIKYIHIIPHVFINDLLEKLRKEGYPFPKDARTFLKTPRNSVIHKIANGEYCHYGIESALVTFLTAYKKQNIDVDCIRLITNIDGAKLHDSSEDSSWIISISETILNLVEVTGIYDGEQKPKDSDDLVKMFVDELVHLINNGIMFEGKQFKVTLHCLVCDAPAKAYVLKTKHFSGYYSCSKCTIEGDYDNKVYFPTRMQQDAVLRTDESFINQQYERRNAVFDDFQKGETIMKKIPHFCPISDVVLDYMHLICLGVMLKLIELWIQNPKVALSEYERQQVSQKLLIFKEFMPCDFNRNPRQFQNVRRLWKAHELRAFLLYTGPVALYNILPPHLYLNFLCLHVAISILVNPILCKDETWLKYAEDLLTKFVESYEEYYGESNMIFNVHNALHLVNDVRRFGSLDNFSAFRFENHIRKVKQLLRKGGKRLQQIANRLMEIRVAKEYYNEDDIEQTDFLHMRKNQEFQIVKTDIFKIDCRNEKDKYVLLDNGTYSECHFFIKGYDGQVHVVGRPLKTSKSFYQHPLSSDLLNINIIESNNFEKSNETFPYKSIFAKVCKIPFENHQFVMVPLIHTYRKN